MSSRLVANRLALASVALIFVSTGATGFAGASDAGPLFCVSAHADVGRRVPGINPSQLLAVDPAAGTVDEMGDIGFNGVSAIDFAPDGTLFGIGYDNAGDYNLIEIDTTTGAGISRGRIKQLFWDEEGRGSFSATRTRCGAGEDLERSLCCATRSSNPCVCAGPSDRSRR